MKKLFAVILSLGLILAPMPAINTAHAQGGAGGYAKIALGMANGIVGSTILTKCQPTGGWMVSPYIFLAGSLVYVAAEILGGKKKAKDVENNDRENAEFKAGMKEGGDYQKRAVQSQIDNEQSNLDHIKKKRKWMKATKTVYTLAMAAAIFETVCASIPQCKAFTGVTATMTCNDSDTSALVSKGVVMAYQALQAYSAGGMMGAAMVGAMALFKVQLGIATKVVNLAMKGMQTGYTRIAIFAAAMILVGVIDGELAKEEARSQKIIDDLKKVLASFDGADNSLDEGMAASGSGPGTNGLGGNQNDPSKKKYDLKGLGAGTQIAKHCFSSTSAGTDFSEAGCKSPLRLTKPTFVGDMNIPTMVDGTNAAIDMANAISSGDIASADTAAANLASMAGRIDSLKNNLLSKLNNDLKKQGKKPIDINSALKQQVDAFNSEMNKNSAGSGNLNMADLNAGEAAVSSEVTGADDIKASEITTVAAPEAPPIDAGIDLSKIESELGAEGAVDPNADSGKVASLEDSLGAYESNESDISKDQGVSIFKQLSNRYILNYEKIFQRKQINPPLAEPQPTN